MGNNYNAGYYINFIVVRHAAGDSVQGGLRVYLIQDGAVSKIITGEIKDGLEREVNITSAVNLVLDRVPKDHLLDGNRVVSFSPASRLPDRVYVAGLGHIAPEDSHYQDTLQGVMLRIVTEQLNARRVENGKLPIGKIAKFAGDVPLDLLAAYGLAQQ